MDKINILTGGVDSIINNNDLSNYGESINLNGMVYKKRDLGEISFIVLITSRDFIQCVLEGEIVKTNSYLKTGDFIKVTGILEQSDKAYKGKEIRVEKIEKISGPVEELIVNISSKAMKTINIDTLLDHRLITLRNIEQRAIFKLQEGVTIAFREFLNFNGFTEIHSPKLVSGTAEGGANVFKMDYFGKTVFLAQSPQFYKQYMVPVFERVYETGPVFRAEKHSTTRHSNEYTSLDIEMGYIKSFRDLMNLEVSMLKYIINYLNKNYKNELNLLKIDLPSVDNGIPEVKFSEIKGIVANKYGRKFRDIYDLEPEEEKLIGKYIKEVTGSDFVFVTNYPAKKRPFYTMLSKEDKNYTDSYDLLYKGLEITTGGQRIHDYETQKQRMIEKGLNPDDFVDYLNLHKNGVPPHGGFAIGLERILLSLIGKNNIRETTLFPRDINRMTP